MGTGVVRADEVMIPMADGTMLAADVVTLDDGEARPTLLVRTPYSRIATRAADDTIGLARQGWSVVIQDVRGRFDSEGDFDPYRQEPSDGADTIAWCAEQPWSNGRVATWGPSYVGATQFLASSALPPALGAIAPMVSSAYYDDGWTFEGGALNLGFIMPWAALMAASDPKITEATQAGLAELATDWDAAYRIPLRDHPVRTLFPAFAGWIAQDHESAFAGAAVSEAFTEMDVPGFHVAGWFDVFCDNSLRSWQGMRDHSATERARVGQRLVVGPWTHERLFLGTTPEMDFGIVGDGMAADIRGEMLQWLTRALGGDDVEGGARVFVMGKGEWIELDQWPPPSTATTFWLDSSDGANGLAGDGALVASEPAGAGADHFSYDPDDPVPTRGGRTLGPFLPMSGPVDQRPVEIRDDVLVYTSAPLDRDLTVIGDVRATIGFATSGRSADVTVKVVDVHPDGKAFNVVDSVRRAKFEPGVAQLVQVDVGSTAMCFLAGHRIRVEVSSSNFPRFDRNPSTGEHAGDARALHGADQTVSLGGSTASTIILPVVN